MRWELRKNSSRWIVLKAKVLDGYENYGRLCLAGEYRVRRN